MLKQGDIPQLAAGGILKDSNIQEFNEIVRGSNIPLVEHLSQIGFSPPGRHEELDHYLVSY